MISHLLNSAKQSIRGRNVIDHSKSSKYLKVNSHYEVNQRDQSLSGP